jgi:sialic acid synthase SpsE
MLHTKNGLCCITGCTRTASATIEYLMEREIGGQRALSVSFGVDLGVCDHHFEMAVELGAITRDTTGGYRSVSPDKLAFIC